VYAVCTLLLPKERVALADIIARRDQLPLANRAAYRDVLIESKSSAASPAAGGTTVTAITGSVATTVTAEAATGHARALTHAAEGKSVGSGAQEEELRGDLKQFYEQVFVPEVSPAGVKALCS
jgi:hypothetical protein